MARNILEVARLIRCLESEELTDKEKAQQIKMVVENGDITVAEAIELCLEYFN